MPDSNQVKQGLYDPQYEHDACGMGFIVNLNGEKTHEIVRKGIEILINLTHRGACGCDPETGDGAGITIQIPHEFFSRECSELGFSLPEPGSYGVGMMFLPVEPKQRLICEGIVERIAKEEGLTVLGWRDTPVHADAIGRTARSTQPYIEQVFLRGAANMTQDQLERKLYVVRRRAETEVMEADLTEKEFYYVPSMSSRLITYKGLLLAPQIDDFYRGLRDPETRSSLCMVHQRFSTNTFPSWKLAHPYRFICHNGEINTVRGNVNWMNARESTLSSDLFGDDLAKVFPVIRPNLSDTGSLDNAVEFLTLGGRSLPHVMAMLIPEAWDADSTMPQEKRDFYEYHASLMEPWDGPAAVAFTDGKWIGATLDRNGLRPARYLVTKDGQLIVASETGVLPIKPENVSYKGRLQPGKMLLVNLEEHRIVPDEEIKHALATQQPYGQWLRRNQITIDALPDPTRVHGFEPKTILERQRAFGYTEEDLRILMTPMAENGAEPIGSMGTDTPLACLSDRPQPLFNYFKQMFAQVTNPAIDPIREELVMSLTSYIGTERNVLEETALHCHTLKLPHPILTNFDLERLRRVSWGDFLATTLGALYNPAGGAEALEDALDELCMRASLAIRDGYRLLILSDRGIDKDKAPIPSLLALTAVHNHLVRERKRTQVALIIESGEPREVMHFALLTGYGASAINPYLAIETLEDMSQKGLLTVDFPTALKNYKKAINKGLLKVFSKMGISTLQSYRGAQIFEAIGLNQELIDRYFTGTASRIEGVGLEVLAREAQTKHEHAFRPATESETELEVGGTYQYRVKGEYHLLNPLTVSKLQHAVHKGPEEGYSTFQEYAALIDQQNKDLCTLRGLMVLREPKRGVKIEEVEPASEIVKRFATGAMSFGSISKEAHETLAIAMNRIGGRSNTGEGGEDEARFRARSERRLAAQLHQAGGFRTLRRHRQLSGQRGRSADQDLAGRETRRGRPASRPQGGRGHRAGALFGSRRGIDFAAAASRYLLDRRSGAVDLRPEKRQSQGQDFGQAGFRIGRRHGGRGCGQGPRRRGSDRRARRRDGSIAADLHQACRHSLGAGAGGNAAGAGPERPAQPHHRADRRQAQDRPGRGHRRAAGRRGIRLLHRAFGRDGLHHDAQVPSEHLPGGHRHARSGLAQEVPRQARGRHQLLLLRSRAGSRNHGQAGLPQDG